MSVTKEMKRRDFIKLGLAAAAALATPVSLAPLAEAAAGAGRFVETRLKMGTLVTLTLVGNSRDRSREAMDKAWAEMDRLIAVFDRHQPGTVISELNRTGRLSGPTPEMLDVLSQAREIHALSQGAFDPTILPLLSLIEQSFENTGRPPDKAELDEALMSVDFGGVGFGPSEVRLGRADRRLSLDGVAKGYIVDRAGAKIKEAGINNALINAGGDVLALGRSHTGRPWRIAVQDPFDSAKYARIIALSDQAVATSGSYEVYFDQKQNYHHILNPKAGRPAGGLVSATVIAPSAARADALATAGFVDPDIFKQGQAQGLIIARNARQIMTTGFKNLLVRG